MDIVFFPVDGDIFDNATTEHDDSDDSENYDEESYDEESYDEYEDYGEYHTDLLEIAHESDTVWLHSSNKTEAFIIKIITTFPQFSEINEIVENPKIANDIKYGVIFKKNLAIFKDKIESISDEEIEKLLVAEQADFSLEDVKYYLKRISGFIQHLIEEKLVLSIILY